MAFPLAWIAFELRMAALLFSHQRLCFVQAQCSVPKTDRSRKTSDSKHRFVVGLLLFGLASYLRSTSQRYHLAFAVQILAYNRQRGILAACSWEMLNNPKKWFCKWNTTHFSSLRLESLGEQSPMGKCSQKCFPNFQTAEFLMLLVWSKWKLSASTYCIGRKDVGKHCSSQSLPKSGDPSPIFLLWTS